MLIIITIQYLQLQIKPKLSQRNYLEILHGF